MNLQKKSNEEILEIANPLWDNLVSCSNSRNYSGFTKDFSSQMLYGANEVELGKQWASSELLVSLSENIEIMGCLRRKNFVTILFKQKSEKVSGEFLGRLVLGDENNMVKIFGATIF